MVSHSESRFEQLSSQDLGPSWMPASDTVTRVNSKPSASLQQEEAMKGVEGGEGRVSGTSVQPVLCRASPVSFVKMTTMTTTHLATPTSPLATLWKRVTLPPIFFLLSHTHQLQ